MNDLREPPYAGGLDSNGALCFPDGTSAPTTGSPHRTVGMLKRPGEGSFGMTLEQHSEATANDYPRVSYVFPNSAAWRAGLRSGWTIESINSVSCRGRLVRDVASMFRDLQEVTMSIDVRTETVPTASSAFAPPQQRGPVGPSTTSMQPVHSTVAMTPASSSSIASVTNGSTATSQRTQQLPAVKTQAAAVQPTTMATPGAKSQPARLTSNGTSAHQSTTTAPPSAPSASAASPSTTIPTLVVAPKPSTARPAVSTVASSAPPPSVSSAATTAASRPQPPSTTPEAVAAHTAPAAPHTATEPSRAAGKKRARSQSDQHVASVARERTSAATAAEQPSGKKRGRPQKRRQSAPTPAVMDISDASDMDYSGFVYCSEEDDPDVEEVSPPPTSSRRTSSRQAESGGRVRRSLTISRLMDMGFKQEDAELSVQACGQDPDKCMLWLVSYREEQQFMNDLNQASIESENQRRLDAEQQNKQELETLRQATAFASLFPTSYILSDVANAPRLREMLSSTIGEIAADTLMRTLVTKLLTVESKAIRWYKEACKCYMLQLAARLETAFASHDVVACCAMFMASQPASAACAFVQALHEEEQALTQALFFMPENQGGVPLEFLRADESMQFSLDDDGFEVVDQAPSSAASPGRD